MLAYITLCDMIGQRKLAPNHEHHDVITRALRENSATSLLNLSGASGTGKGFFLHTVKVFSKEEVGRDGFVQAAAPSSTAA